MSSPVTPEPPPTDGVGSPIFELVIADIRTKSEAGRWKYGRYLRAHDGRRGLRDAYQEAIDLAIYLRKEIADQERHAGCPGCALCGYGMQEQP